MNQEEIRARDEKMLEGWVMTGLDESGYPDYFEYDWQDSKVVQSWWRFRLTRSSDGKEVVVPVLFIDDFDDDVINKPNHYNQGNIEVSDFIIDQNMNFLEGNIIKYVSRYKTKNGIEDLKKARWYLNKLIEANENEITK